MTISKPAICCMKSEKTPDDKCGGRLVDKYTINAVVEGGHWFNICLCEYQHRRAGHKHENLPQMCGQLKPKKNQTMDQIQTAYADYFSACCQQLLCYVQLSSRQCLKCSEPHNILIFS